MSSIVRLAAASVLACSLVGASVGAAGGDAATGSAERRLLERFHLALEAVQQNYVQEADPEKLVDAALEAMLNSLDRYSKYMPPNDLENVQSLTSGEVGGIGVNVRPYEAGARITSILAGTPAAEAGLRPNDVITHVDGWPLAGQARREVEKVLRGHVGSRVVLTVRRAGAAPADYALARALIRDVPVFYQAVGDVGVIRLSQFNRGVSGAIYDAVLKLRSRIGPVLKGYVLDLRDNPGGLTWEAIRVADLFLESGPIVIIRGRRAEHSGTPVAKPGDIAGGLPLVVLVNGGSASASEIVAGALQDHRRAAIVGEKTYGKGSVQTIMDLGDGYGIKLTTAHYFTPGGRSIDKVGLTPDIVTPDVTVEPTQTDGQADGAATEAGDPQLRVALDTVADLCRHYVGAHSLGGRQGPQC